MATQGHVRVDSESFNKEVRMKTRKDGYMIPSNYARPDNYSGHSGSHRIVNKQYMYSDHRRGHSSYQGYPQNNKYVMQNDPYYGQYQMDKGSRHQNQMMKQSNSGHMGYGYFNHNSIRTDN